MVVCLLAFQQSCKVGMFFFKKKKHEQEKKTHLCWRGSAKITFSNPLNGSPALFFRCWRYLHSVAQSSAVTGVCHYIPLSHSILSPQTHKRQEEVKLLNYQCRQTYYSRPFLFVYISRRRWRQLVRGGYLSCTAGHPLLHWRGLGCCL